MNAVLLSIPLVAIVCAVVWYKRCTRHHPAWKSVARRFDLDFSRGGLRLQTKLRGRHRRRAITVQLKKSGWGRRRNCFTNFSVPLQAPCWERLSVIRRLFNASGQPLMDDDGPQIGDPDFDSEFRLSGEVDDKARQCLENASVQSALRSFHEDGYSFLILVGKLSINATIEKNSEEDLVRLIERTIDTAELLDDTGRTIDGASEAGSEEAQAQKQSTEHIW